MKIKHETPKVETNTKKNDKKGLKISDLHCDICNVKFNSKKEFIEHIKIMEHKDEKINCEFCEKQLSSFSYNRHIKLLHSGSFTCNVCDTKFDIKKVSFQPMNFILFLLL